MNITAKEETKRFFEIVNRCDDEDFTGAAFKCIEHGFYANDLIFYNDRYRGQGIGFVQESDIARLIEVSTQLRFITNKR